MEKRLCVNFIEVNGQVRKKLESLKQIEDFLCKIENGSINEIAFYLDNSNIILNVFAEKNKYHIGIIDEDSDINYYYFNGSNTDKKLIEINGNLYEKSMVCFDINILEKVINMFVINGEKCTEVLWIEE